MDESALKTLISTLEAHKDALGIWLNIFSAMVAVGVVAEFAFVIREYREELHDWRRGIVRPPDRPSRFWFMMELAGIVLVSLGVAGEFWVDVRAGGLETQLRKANHDLVLLLEQRVQSAEDSARGASDAAGKAESKADAADTAAGRALGVATTAKSQAVEVAEAVNLAKKDLIDLQSRIAWRTVSDEQKKELKDRLWMFSGDKVILRWSIIDPEQNFFAPQVSEALQSAGLNVQNDSFGMSDDTTLGISLSGKRDFASSVFAKAFVCSFLTNRPIVRKPEELPAGVRIAIFIGPKEPIKKKDAATQSECEQ